MYEKSAQCISAPLCLQFATRCAIVWTSLLGNKPSCWLGRSGETDKTCWRKPRGSSLVHASVLQRMRKCIPELLELWSRWAVRAEVRTLHTDEGITQNVAEERKHQVDVRSHSSFTLEPDYEATYCNQDSMTGEVWKFALAVIWCLLRQAEADSQFGMNSMNP